MDNKHFVLSIKRTPMSIAFLCNIRTDFCSSSIQRERTLRWVYICSICCVYIYAGDCLSFYSLKICKDCNIKLIILVVKLVLSLCGFLLYCFLAHWYKMRVRDDVYSVHRVVEEVYDRYLTAESQRRQFFSAPQKTL